eukprot:m.133917 g.133917  ORF g.133917 m.133917 type:complete len:55 (+) comp22506_c0_seq1:1567-1731(+)
MGMGRLQALAQQSAAQCGRIPTALCDGTIHSITSLHHFEVSPCTLHPSLTSAAL